MLILKFSPVYSSTKNLWSIRIYVIYFNHWTFKFDGGHYTFSVHQQNSAKYQLLFYYIGIKFCIRDTHKWKDINQRSGDQFVSRGYHYVLDMIVKLTMRFQISFSIHFYHTNVVTLIHSKAFTSKVIKHLFKSQLSLPDCYLSIK